MDINQSFNHETKKSRSLCSKSMTCIETLSNEVFLEIFDYLDGCDILNAFSNLNSRFQDLINSSKLLLKIRLCSKSKDLL